jgi:hypothetical protein
MNIQRLLLAAIVVSLSIAAIPSGAEARQARTGSGQVVHTRRLPVILHRAVPPQYGKHVYAGRR